jgi:hypothetical protein
LNVLQYYLDEKSTPSTPSSSSSSSDHHLPSLESTEQLFWEMLPFCNNDYQFYHIFQLFEKLTLKYDQIQQQLHLEKQQKNSSSSSAVDNAATSSAWSASSVSGGSEQQQQRQQ